MLCARTTEFQQIPTVSGVFEWFSPAHTVVRSADFHRSSLEDNGNQRIKAPVERDQSAVLNRCCISKRKLANNDQTVKAKMGHNSNEQDGGIPSTYINPGETSNFPCPLSVTWSAVPYTDGRPHLEEYVSAQKLR
jgi:hypothetical protein